MILKSLLNVLNSFIDNKMVDKKKEYTEDELLKAIDEFVEKEKSSTPLGYRKEELTCIVPKVKVWSDFKYLSSAYIDFNADNRLFYLIPCGIEVSEEAKVWYLGFYSGDTSDDVFEFSTSVGMDSYTNTGK